MSPGTSKEIINTQNLLMRDDQSSVSQKEIVENIDMKCHILKHSYLEWIADILCFLNDIMIFNVAYLNAFNLAVFTLEKDELSSHEVSLNFEETLFYLRSEKILDF